MGENKKRLFTSKKFKVPAEIIETEDLIATSEKRQKELDVETVGLKDVELVKQYSEGQVGYNKDITDLFPDIGLSVEIIVSSILNPNEMLGTNLYYKFNNSKLPADLAGTLSLKIKDYIKDNYDLEQRLYGIIEESMFLKGAHAELILPSNIVNSLYESYSKSVRKRNSTQAGFEESIATFVSESTNKILKTKTTLDGLMSFTENVNLLMAEEDYKGILDTRLDKVYSGDGKDLESVVSAGFEDDTITEDILSIFDDGGSKDMPFVKKVTATSVIPIINVEDPSRHYGYFIVLDKVGKPVTDGAGEYGSRDKLFDELDKSAMDTAMSNAKSLVQNTGGTPPIMNNINDARESLIIKQLKRSLDNTPFDGLGKVDVEGRDDLIDIMLKRVLEKEKINVLFVPENLLAYYAFKYRSNGTGETILEKLGLLTSMRAITMFSDLTSYVKSSIPLTKVTATIDDDDTDYRRTMKKIISGVMSNRQIGLPIGIIKVNDITEWLAKAGFSFDFNHPGLPDTKIEINEAAVEINPTNTDLKEDLDKKIIRTLGLPPELIDNAFGPEFATSIVANNALLARRISSYQDTYNKHITGHVTKILRVDGILKNEIIELIRPTLKSVRKHLKKHISDKDKKKSIDEVSDDRLAESIYLDIIKRLEITLPVPENEEDSKVEESFNKFTSRLDDFMDIVINSDVLPDEIVGEIGDKMESVKSLLKSIIVKKWAGQHGYLPEVMSMVSIGEDGKPVLNVLEEYKAHLSVIESSIIPFLKEMYKTKGKINDEIDKIEEEEEEPEEPLEAEVVNNEEPLEGEEEDVIEEPEIEPGENEEPEEDIEPKID